MSKYIVETFYTCTFKIIHELNELNEKKLSDLENRNDGKVQIINVTLNNRKTKTANQKENFKNSQNKIETKNIPNISSIIIDELKLFNIFALKIFPPYFLTSFAPTILFSL